MKKLLLKIFHYLEPIWCGSDNKPSIQRVLAIIFSVHIIQNINFAVHKWGEGKSLADMGMIVGLELGFVGALIGISQWSNFLNRKIDAQKPGGE